MNSEELMRLALGLALLEAAEVTNPNQHCTSTEGSAEGLVDSCGYAARVAAGSIMVSNSTGVSFPSAR